MTSFLFSWLDICGGSLFDVLNAYVNTAWIRALRGSNGGQPSDHLWRKLLGNLFFYQIDKE